MATVYNQQLTAMLPVITLIFILLLPLTIGAFYLNQYLQERKRIISDHKKEVREIRMIFYKAIDFQFMRTPLIVQTRKEFAYYNKLLVHYKNSTRKVEHIAFNLGETSASHSVRIKNYVDKYCNDELEAIKQGQNAHGKYFENLWDKGALDYFKTPYNTEESKAFIYSKIDFLLKNPTAEYGSYKKDNASVIEF